MVLIFKSYDIPSPHFTGGLMMKVSIAALQKALLKMINRNPA